jgi:ligand-binding sensor domain-containing protein
VFQSDNHGTTWQDVDRGKLPEVPHHAAVVPPASPNTLYVSSDAGVFMSTDLGKTWSNFTLKLPNTMVIVLVYQQSDRTLLGATYGQSIYRIEL